MKMKIVASAKVFDPRVNVKNKWSAEALMFVSEVTEQPSFSESQIAELIEGVTNSPALKDIWEWLKNHSTGKDAPQVFFEKLGFRAADLSAAELINLKILLGKFVRPKLRELKSEKTALQKRIRSLDGIIKLTRKR